MKEMLYTIACLNKCMSSQTKNPGNYNLIDRLTNQGGENDEREV